jgi:hypothetical protein
MPEFRRTHIATTLACKSDELFISLRLYENANVFADSADEKLIEADTGVCP